MNLRIQNISARPMLQSAPQGSFVPPMQVHRPGALDYQDKPSLEHGRRVPYKAAIAMSSKVPSGISYQHAGDAK